MYNQINKWIDFSYKIDSHILTNNQISLALDSLNSQELLPLLELYNKDNLASRDNLKLLIIFKIKTVNQQRRTISYMQTLGISEFNQLYEIFSEYWNLKTEDYYLAAISEITFTYKIVDETTNNYYELPSKLLRAEDKVKSITESKGHERLNKLNPLCVAFGGFNLPLTMDFTTWGDCHFINDHQIIVYKKSSSLEYHIVLHENYQDVELKSNNKILLRFKDTIIVPAGTTNDLNSLSFTRAFKNQEYIIDDGKIILKKIHKKVSFLTKKTRNMNNSKKIITMDLETRVINGIMSSYCVSVYDGKVFKSFYLSDFSNEKEMLRESILYLMKRKYHNYKVYLHNFSRFDAVFLLTTITEICDNVLPIKRDANFISIKLIFANKYCLYFRDSFLLLPSSLRNLALNFEVDNKGVFPYKFVNNNIPLNYVGNLPEYHFFDNITEKEYESYCSEYKNKN